MNVILQINIKEEDALTQKFLAEKMAISTKEVKDLQKEYENELKLIQKVRNIYKRKKICL